MLIEKKDTKTQVCIRLGGPGLEAYHSLPDSVQARFPEESETHILNKNTLAEAALRYFREEIEAGNVDAKRLFGEE